jgi:hypothetical protein
MKKIILLFVLLLILAACGTGIPDGRFVPRDEGAPYSFIDFSGARVEIGLINDLGAKGQFQHRNGNITLRTHIGTYSFGIEVINDDSYVITHNNQRFTYVRE